MKLTILVACLMFGTAALAAENGAELFQKAVTPGNAEILSRIEIQIQPLCQFEKLLPPLARLNRAINNTDYDKDKHRHKHDGHQVLHAIVLD